jgi:hypothetical protein
VAIQEGIAHNSDVALSLTGSLWRFWWARGYLSGGRALLEAALNCESASAQLRARALRGLAAIALAQGEINGQHRACAIRASGAELVVVAE